MVWHWLTMFGKWVYHHETMCRVHSWTRHDLELWPQGQIYRVFDMFSCPVHNFFLDRHWLTIFGTWMYHHQTMCRVHHDPDSMLIFDLKVKFKGFCHVFMYDLKLLLALTLAYQIWQIGLSPWEDVSGTFMILIQPWTLTSRSNYRVYDIALCAGLSYFVL